MGLDLGYKVDVAANHRNSLKISFIKELKVRQLKEHLKGVCINSTDEAKHAAKTWLKNQSAEFFKNSINGWKHHLGKCINHDGGHAEK